MSVKVGFMSTDEVMIATAASELSTNIIRYAKKGEIIISIIKNLKDGRKGLEIYASDNGPGIRDIELAMQEQYSSLPNSLGLGLPSVKRIMDEFYIESLMGRGTRVLVRRWRI
ncbi:MAG: anti-sigma regulatory factor [Vallitalea sp.]|nr:anti-sigma regulatory factor [Vallitalea sp.]